MASSNIRWISAVIDLPDECFGAGKAFWWETTEFRPNLPSWNDPNFAVMQPEPASTTPHLWIQRLWEGEPRVHLDISVGDTVEAADVVRALGGSCEAPLQGASHVRGATPAGIEFCLVAGEVPVRQPEQLTGTAVVGVGTAVSRQRLEAEVEFWDGLLGLPASSSSAATQWHHDDRFQVIPVIGAARDGAEPSTWVELCDLESELPRSWADRGCTEAQSPLAVASVGDDDGSTWWETPSETLVRIVGLRAQRRRG